MFGIGEPTFGASGEITNYKRKIGGKLIFLNYTSS